MKYSSCFPFSSCSQPAVSQFYCNGDPSSVLDEGVRLAGRITIIIAIHTANRVTESKGKWTSQSETRDGDKLLCENKKQQKHRSDVMKLLLVVSHSLNKTKLRIQNNQNVALNDFCLLSLHSPRKRKEGSVEQQSFGVLIPLSLFVNYNVPAESFCKTLRNKRLTAYRNGFSSLSPSSDGVERERVNLFL